jgi:hypothetical protein
MHLVGMDTLLILLSLGPGHHHPRARMSHFLIKPAIQTSTSVLTPTSYHFCKKVVILFLIKPAMETSTSTPTSTGFHGYAKIKYEKLPHMFVKAMRGTCESTISSTPN